MREVTFVEAIREAQTEALEVDDRVFVLGQDGCGPSLAQMKAVKPQLVFSSTS